MIRRLAPLAIAAALLPLALAGCGDALSAAELRARATAICARTAAATDRIALPGEPSQGGRFLRQGLARLRPAAVQLRALKAPDALHARYERAVQLAGSEIALIRTHERAIARGEDAIATYRRLAGALAPLVRDENAAWRGLGVPACVRR